MKYRTRLYLLFLASGVLVLIISMLFIRFQTQKALFGELQGKVIAIAATTAVGISGDQVKKIQTPADQNSLDYKQIQAELRSARDVNRKKEIYIKYLYITRPDPNDPKKFIFVVDPEENPKDFSPVGQKNPLATQQNLHEHLLEGYSYGELRKDPWGEWLTGSFPIMDSQGKYVGTVAADMDAALVRKSLNRVYYYLALSFMVSLLFAAFASAALSHRTSNAIESLAHAAVEIGKGNLAYRVDLGRNDEFQTLADALNQMCAGLEEKERLKSGFSHYVSKHVMEQIMQAGGATKLHGEKRKVTIFFSDIFGFTEMSETMSPEDVVSLLNEYFQVMIKIIFKYNGMLDKLIGDGIMAEFGVPLEDSEQEKHAVLAAIEMNRALIGLCEKWKNEGRPQIKMGIGMHTGEAIVGSIGSEEKMEYTAIGDTVNIAARLERVTRESKYPIIISESIYSKVHHQFKCVDLGVIDLKGRKKPIKAYGIDPHNC